jgi:predicted Rossmann fold nucleotide-binding protein DprA/Smf involved in DNA uptake
VKVIVAGSRTFDDRALAFAKLDRILANVGPGECTIISGGARGADRIGEAYARARGLKCEVFPATPGHMKGNTFGTSDLVKADIQPRAAPAT